MREAIVVLGVAAAVCLSLAACTPDLEYLPADLVIEDVTVVHPDHQMGFPAMEADQWVLIKGGRIVGVGSDLRPLESAGLTRVSGAGRFLIPGLADMHDHTGNSAGFMQSLAHGLTLVRQTDGWAKILAIRDSIAAGHIAGPDLIVTSPIVHGGGLWAASSANPLVEDSLDGVEAVRDLSSQGYDQIKVYGRVPAPAFHGIMAESRRLGMPVVGHVSQELGLRGVLAAGQRSIEHQAGFLPSLLPDSLVETLPQGLTRVKAWRHADLERIDSVARAVREAGAFNVPTLMTRLFVSPDSVIDRYLNDLGPYRDAWGVDFLLDRSSKSFYDGFDEAGYEVTQEGFVARDSLLRALVGVGAEVVAGTDQNPHGPALHFELQRLVWAGLSPRQALRAATRAAALLADRDSLGGLIVPDAPADLVILDADPLEDMRNTRKIEAVVKGGVLYDREALDSLLVEVNGWYPRDGRKVWPDSAGTTEMPGS